MNALLSISILSVAGILASEDVRVPGSRDNSPGFEILACIPRLQSVNSMLLSPDGRILATLRGENTSWNEGGRPLTLQVWSLPRGDLLWTAQKPVFNLLGFSPDSTRLVGVSEDTKVVLWDTATGRIRSRLRPKNVSYSAAVFGTDGRTLITSMNKFEGSAFPEQPTSGVIRLWKAKNGRFIRELKAQTNAIQTLAVSPDGKTLAVANQLHGPGNTVNLVDLATDSARCVLRFKDESWFIPSVAFSPDGRTVAAVGGTLDGRGGVTLWDVASGELQRTLTNMGVTPVWWESYVAFSPDGKTLAIAGENRTIILWDLADSKWRGSLGPNEPPYPGRYVMQFVRDGLLLAGVNPFQQVEVTLWDYP